MAALLPMHAAAETFRGVVTHVSDGDTVWVRRDGGERRPVKVRLGGLDAPERCQAWGDEASAALASRVLSQAVTVQAGATDVYDRRLVTLFVDGEDVGAWLVAHGHAWSTGFRRHPGRYAAQQQAARAARLGLFADAQAIEPRFFRKRHGACPMPPRVGHRH
jgi:micrococcal nuclease